MDGWEDSRVSEIGMSPSSSKPFNVVIEGGT